MNYVLALVLALLAAVHVSVAGIPAPVPVSLFFGGVIFTLCWLIYEAAFRSRPHWRAGP